MIDLLQNLISGVTTGAIYSLIALGFTIVFNGTKVTNFANGEFVMMGGLLSAWLVKSAHLPVFFAIVGAVVIVAALAIAIDKFCIQQSRRKTILGYAMVTIGASILCRGLMQIVVGREVIFMPEFGILPTVKASGVYVMPQYLWVLLTLLIASTLLWYLFLRTRIGKAMRAASQVPRAAQLCGIEPSRMSMLSFAMAAVAGALAGALVTPIGGAFYENGLVYGLKGFAAAVLGGFGSPVGAVLGGILIGVAESLSAGYLSSAYKDAVSLAILLALLLLRPSGLLGRVEARRV
jgi:branched-chain amino acid transport system permease protein